MYSVYFIFPGTRHQNHPYRKLRRPHQNVLDQKNKRKQHPGSQAIPDVPDQIILRLYMRHTPLYPKTKTASLWSPIGYRKLGAYCFNNLAVEKSLCLTKNSVCLALTDMLTFLQAGYFFIQSFQFLI